eukprot:g7042.t1 g7042   contig23:1739931-1740591(+)
MLKLALAFVLSLPAASGFTASLQNSVVRRSTKLHFHPEKFNRAVDCASNYGLCDVDELLNLAQDLEDYQGCFYEDGAEACQKEIDDRHDLSNVLLLQGEMQERTRYLKEGNLFAYDVKADQDMHERDEFIEHVVPELDL